VQLCLKHLPGYPVAYIGFSVAYARQLLRIPNLDLNMLQYSLAGPCGSGLVREAREKQRRVFDWTVDDEAWMEWSIGRGMDAVITNDPKKFLDVCERWRGGREEDRWAASRKRPLKAKVKEAGFWVLFEFMTFVIGLIFVWRTRGTPAMHVKKAMRG
jgi:hypothetical protein